MVWIAGLGFELLGNPPNPPLWGLQGNQSWAQHPSCTRASGDLESDKKSLSVCVPFQTLVTFVGRYSFWGGIEGKPKGTYVFWFPLFLGLWLEYCLLTPNHFRGKQKVPFCWSINAGSENMEVCNGFLSSGTLFPGPPLFSGTRNKILFLVDWFPKNVFSPLCYKSKRGFSEPLPADAGSISVSQLFNGTPPWFLASTRKRIPFSLHWSLGGREKLSRRDL